MMKKFLSLCVCALMMFSLVGTANATNAESSTGSNAVDIDKTATQLNEKDQSTVTLKIGADEDQSKVAVMFLIDKSTSQGIRDEAADMLDELKSKMNTKILYNVVIFSGTATSTGWKDVQDDASLENTKENFINKETTSGTNLDAGIEEASEQMNALPEEYKDASKYLITLSDGITYVWSEDGEVKCVPIEGLGNNGVETPAQNGTDTWAMMYEYGMSISDIYGSMDQFMDNVTTKIDTTRAEGHVQNYYDKSSSLSNPIQTYIYDDDKNAEVAEKYATGIEIAMYESVNDYQKLIKMFDYTYAYAVPEADSNGMDNTSNWNNYPWGKELMEYLQSFSSNKDQSIEVSNADPEVIFSGIKDNILYTIESGTVTDVMGQDFDFAGVDTLTLTVGGVEIEGIVSENKVIFGDYAVVNYDPETDTLTWSINMPVQEGAPLALSYVVNLVNKNTEPGEYAVPTNEKAILEYTTTMGETGEAIFPIPEVSYVVEKIEEPIEPEEPVTPQEPTNPDSGVVQTSDSVDVMKYVYLAGIAITVGGIILAYKKKEDLLQK